MVGVSLALGPIVGGALTESIGWRSIFWINVPIGLAAIVLTALFVPESRAARPRRVDPVGQLLVIVALASLTYAIIDGAERRLGLGADDRPVRARGWRPWRPSCCMSCGARDPLIELRFFRSAPFSGATLIAISAFAAFGGFLFLNTLYLQDVRGYSALQAGLCTLPMAAMAIVAPAVGTARGQPRPAAAAADRRRRACSSRTLMLTSLTPTTPLALLLVAYAIFGMGFGAVNPPITYTAVSGMPDNQAGVAAAVASTSRQVGQTLGVAVIGSILGHGRGGTARGLAAGQPPGLVGDRRLRRRSCSSSVCRLHWCVGAAHCPLQLPSSDPSATASARALARQPGGLAS